ncbi:hypothetical protein N665_0237s0086 [Sinapis alba]|nr:hypothetical protein N665_0237s0086 [Sinapis alba]
MKRSKKSRVSWPPGPKLCQVKMFRTEDCPAKVASSYPKQSSGKRQVPDLPPGFEGNHYADKLSVSTIPRIKWKRPPKFLVSDAWLMGDGGESTERRTENLRISKVLEAVYPHRSTIPSRPSVSPVVEAESFDDRKTPAIRLTPIEDESESSEDSSNTSLESGFTTSKQSLLETKPPCSIQELVSRLAPELSLAASAALAALMKTSEQGSLVDPELLIKLLSDPKMIKNLITDTAGKSSETKNHPLETNNMLVQQHVTALPMTTPHPAILPQKQSFTASQPFTKPEQRQVSPPKPEQRQVSPPKPEQRRVSPPKPVNQNISSLNQINRNPVSIPTSVQPCVSIATQPSLPARLPSRSLPMNVNHQRPPHVFSEPKVTMNPQPQPQHNSAYRSCEMNNVQAPVGFGRGPQTGFNNYPMNLNRIDVTGRVNPVVQPMRSDDYFKNLIREHGTVNHETTNQYYPQNGKFNGRIDQTKVQKQCMYHGTARGCQMGDSCIYVHDRLRPNFEDEAPRAKRLKFGRYERNGF